MNSGESVLESSECQLFDEKNFWSTFIDLLLTFLPKRQNIRVLKSASSGKMVMWGYEGYELRY